jgi:hypothetical protein
LSVAATARLDLKDNNLILDYADPDPSPLGTWNGSAYTGVAGLIASGRNGGNWSGSGIVTTSATGDYTTLGLAEAPQVLDFSNSITAAWGDQTVDATTVLVKFTYGGDDNADGKINIDDYVHIDQGVAAQIAGWFNGDFNGDGKINIDDYVIIDSNIVSQGPPILNASSATTPTFAAEPGSTAFVQSGINWSLFSSVHVRIDQASDESASLLA